MRFIDDPPIKVINCPKGQRVILNILIAQER